MLRSIFREFEGYERHWTNGSCAASSGVCSLSLASDVIASSGPPLGTRGDGGRRKHPGQEYAKNELKGKEDAPDAELETPKNMHNVVENSDGGD